MTYARNLTGIKEIRGPKLERQTGKPKQRTQAKTKPKRNPLDRGFAIPTREMRVHAELLELWLAGPDANKLPAKEREGMQHKLNFYRRELAVREERRNPKLSGDALAQKFKQAAPRGRQNGIRVVA
jgi:hypothetical protein